MTLNNNFHHAYRDTQRKIRSQQGDNYKMDVKPKWDYGLFLVSHFFSVRSKKTQNLISASLSFSKAISSDSKIVLRSSDLILMYIGIFTEPSLWIQSILIAASFKYLSEVVTHIIIKKNYLCWFEQLLQVLLQQLYILLQLYSAVVTVGLICPYLAIVAEVLEPCVLCYIIVWLLGYSKKAWWLAHLKRAGFESLPQLYVYGLFSPVTAC